MKTLLLMRHAKSDWSNADHGDFDRPLNKRGRRAAQQMAAHLRDTNLIPDLALVSSAARTRETWQRITEELRGLAPRHELRRELYLASPQTLLEAINSISSNPSRLLILGHNPGIELAAGLLAALDQAEAGERVRAAIRNKFPTAGIATLGFPDAPWADIRFGTGLLLDFVTPSTLDS